MSDFFRIEAVRHRQRGAVGGIRLVRPLPLSLATAVIVASAVAVGAWLSLSSYTRKARLPGIVAVDANGALHVDLFATSTAIGSLRVDQVVRLTFPALPPRTQEPRVGTVAAVSRVPLTIAEWPYWLPTRAARDPLYRISARLGPPAAAGSMAGLAVDGEVHIETRRLIAWLFAPRHAAPE